MLKPEAAQALIEKRERKDWIRPFNERTGRLSTERRTHALALAGRTPDGKEIKDWQRRQKILQEAGRYIDSLSAGQRAEYFHELFPRFGAIVDHAWERQKAAPYLEDEGQVPFRAPGEPEWSAASRASWLSSIVEYLSRWDADLAELVGWVPFLPNWDAADTLATLFAAAIDLGGKDGEGVFEGLLASGRNEHPVGGMGNHVIAGLLRSSNEEGWKFVERMLLAAQREEGLRQSILEQVQGAHPGAFRHMLKVILDHDLVRFSATVRAVDVWVGFRWDSISAGVIRNAVESLLAYLSDAKARKSAIDGKDAEQVYLALWCEAFEDAPKALPILQKVIKHPNPEFRYAAGRALALYQKPEAMDAILPLVEDDDLRVSAFALGQLEGFGVDNEGQKKLAGGDVFERLEALIHRYPEKEQELKPILWPWAVSTVSQATVVNRLTEVRGKRPVTRLLPYFGKLSPRNRFWLVVAIGKEKEWNADLRRAVLALLNDASSDVRAEALKTLKKKAFKPDADEIVTLEGYLKRKQVDLRRGVISLLSKQKEAMALASAGRLLQAKTLNEQSAGLEVLRILKESNMAEDKCRDLASEWLAAHPNPEPNEQQALQTILGEAPAKGVSVSRGDAFGLLNHDERTWPAAPKLVKVKLHSAVTSRILTSLDALVHQHRDVPVKLNSRGPDELFGDVHALYLPNRAEQEEAIDEDAPSENVTTNSDDDQLPLREVWEEWFASRPKELCESDGFELVRAEIYVSAALASDFGYGGEDQFHKAKFHLEKRCPDAVHAIFGNEPRPKLTHPQLVMGILSWLTCLHPIEGLPDFLLDCAEAGCALVPPAELTRKSRDYSDSGWRDNDSSFLAWFHEARNAMYRSRAARTPGRVRSLWHLTRWIDQPFGRENSKVSRERPGVETVLWAHQVGAASDADLIDHLIGERPPNTYGDYADLRELTEAKARTRLTPAVAAVVERCRARVLEIELQRGVEETPASEPAQALSSVWGSANLAAILRAFGRQSFARTSGWREKSKEQVLSELVKVCHPNPEDTVETFRAALQSMQFNDERMVELAMFVPRWAPLVEQYLSWPSLAEAVRWVHSHTRSAGYHQAELGVALNSLTALQQSDLMEGAVDVAWFHRVHAALGEKRWEQVDAAAKYASSGTGHSRARMFADAMLGRLEKKELVTRITKKRQQDAVRALGLLPLAAGTKREADLLERYQVMVEFHRSSRQFGSQRQASEKRAVEIGQENLARNAGYRDPLRLQWAMEAREVADLSDGPLVVTEDGVTLSLGIDPWGSVELAITRDGKPLSDIPAKLKKHKPFVALRERRTQLKRQASRIRPALERLMISGESLTGAELPDLMKHPLVAPMLRGLVLVGEGIKGYPVHDGRALRDHAGNEEALKKDESVRIAHPRDLLPAAEWSAWQRECFASERIQPFKQVFRELYVPTKTELGEKHRTTRYAGHQVQPRKALALLGGRGWVNHPEEGVRRTFHDENLVAVIGFQEGFFTPAEVEGLTLESVEFIRRGSNERVEIGQVPPRLFSEVMRDLDLVVSVAHRGGVDPEASQSTVEMRASLVQETCRLLKITNVKVKEPWAIVTGHFGEYGIHLGSATTRKMPGEMLFLIPVHAQHRGRLFLPFADDDPRSAEVLSKVLLLARDQEIKDPGILAQLR